MLCPPEDRLGGISVLRVQRLWHDIEETHHVVADSYWHTSAPGVERSRLRLMPLLLLTDAYFEVSMAY